MTEQLRYFFRKDDKLKGRKLIEAVFTKGKQFTNYPFKVFWLLNQNAGTLQAGVSVSSRNFKKATDRNRVKRLMREAYRLRRHTLGDQLKGKETGLSVFILYVGKDLPEYTMVCEKMDLILNRLKTLTNGKPETHS